MALRTNLLECWPLTSNSVAGTESSGLTLVNSGAAYVSGSPGPAWQYGTNSQLRADSVSLSYPFALAVWWKSSGSLPSGGTLASLTLADGHYFQLLAPTSGFGIMARARQSGTFADANDTGNASSTDWNLSVAIFDSATSTRCWTNGTFGTTDTTSCTPAGSYNRLGFGVIRRDTDSGFIDGVYTKLAAVWQGAVPTDADLDAWFADPTAILPAAAPVLTGPSGAAGAASININVAEDSTALGTWTTTGGGVLDIFGGADAAQVQMVGGVASFIANNNDFENPDDVGANRVYNFTVRSVAPGGTTTQDVVATLTNVIELPGAPTIGTATAGNATVTVPFTPPSAGTAPSIIDYTVTLSPGGATKTVSASPAVFTSADGVVNGTAYTGTVTSRNSDGTGSASAASNSVTPSFVGPVLSSPTKDTPTATTATLGFSTTGVDGTARAVLIQSTTVPTAPNATQVKNGHNAAGNSSGVVAPTALSVTSAGTKNFAAATVTTGLSYYGFIVHTDAAGNDSAVLSLGVLYPGTARPVSDIATAGWTGSSGGPLALLLDENTADDGDFVTSPALSSTPTGLTTAMSRAYGAGTYTGLKVKLWCSTGTCSARIKFLDSGGSAVGTTADIAVTTTPTLFTVSVTLTGTAVSWTIEGDI